MKRVSAAVFGVLVLSVASALVLAKGDMVLIEIKGAAFTTPLRITDPKIDEFNVWAGPGVNGAGLENADGFIADWKKGAVAVPPAGWTHYQLSFYAGCRTDLSCLGERPRLVYVVSYAYDPSSPHGFIHFPGRGDASHELNIGTIYHGPGIEGHWFVATDAWECFVRPLIASARAGGPNRRRAIAP